MTGDTLESNGLSHKRFIAIFVTAGAVSGRKYALLGSERAFSVSENAPFLRGDAVFLANIHFLFGQ